MKHIKLFVLLIGCASVLAGCSNPSLKRVSSDYPISRLEYIGETIVGHDARFDGTPIGGLSGIDYDPMSREYVSISDDRAERGPARAYLGTLPLTRHHVGPFKFTAVIRLKQPDGSLYPNEKQYLRFHKGAVPDLESIRFNPNNHTLRYTSEGDRNLGLNPFIRDALLNGRYLDSLKVPVSFKLDPSHPSWGFNDNLALEGSSFTRNGRYYFASMEAPLKQDGPVPSLKHGAFSRVLKYDNTGHLVGEYVYPVDPLPAKPGPGKHADNGVSEMLAIDQHHLLFLERSGIQDAKGHYHDYIRIYQVSLKGATNVAGRERLIPGTYQPVQKQLLLNLNTLHLPKLDNVEGITFGPRLANGQQTLVLISDNNFNRSEITQIIAFAVVTH
ncbi:MAG: hypothetical protein CENE_01765 [Candidatus Celerinatantimonas neptuna]|nr:MAG: hypothetical protein CENE_01765 [Candidatus Celerinatantimonas neptuna]